MSTTTRTEFTAAELNQLRASYSTLERIDPSSPAYERLISMLDGLELPQLKQLAGAGVAFVSMLAANRVRRAER